MAGPPNERGPGRRLFFLVLLGLTVAASVTAAASVHHHRHRHHSHADPPAAPPSGVPLPFPLPSKIARDANNTTPLALNPRAFRMVDASRTPTRTVALALERYWALTFPHDPTPPAHAETAVVGGDEEEDATTSVSRRLRAAARGTAPVEEEEELVALRGLRVVVADPSEAPPQLETDESYTLEIPAPLAPQLGVVATLRAPTVYGALRGLESFSQLVVFDWAHASAATNNDEDEKGFVAGPLRPAHRYLLPAGAPLAISDAPRFPWRGLLLDTGRHFQPVAHIEALLDSMAHAKLNVLHWHLVDSESFPFESRAYPKLWDGAFTPDERYLQDEVAGIVEFARLRGIRVVPEFDVPGHAASWCRGYPEICPSPQCLQPLDPSNPATLELVAGLLLEVSGGPKAAPGTGLFPDAFVHLGGDEVFTGCWTDTAHVAAWMQQQGNWTAQDTYKFFVDFAARSALAAGRAPVQWVEVWDEFGTALHPETVVHIWKEKATARPVVAAGYRAVLSDNDLWYLDHLDVPWQRFYDNEPWEGIQDPDQQQLILGGEACMWGEFVDPSDLLPTVWPRAAAVAERLWSAAVASTTSASQTMPDGTPNDVHDRLRRFRCLLLRRGVGAAPLENDHARDAPHGPGSCYGQ